MRYWDQTSIGIPFNEDIQLKREYSDDEEELLRSDLKKELIKKLRNTVRESDIRIDSWTEISI